MQARFGIQCRMAGSESGDRDSHWNGTLRVDEIIVRPLEIPQILQVYPLIREAVPTIGLDDWCRYARAQIDPRRRRRIAGIRVAQHPEQVFPSGLYCYHLDTGLLSKNTLIADHFIALDLVDPSVIARRLIADLDSLGTSLGATEIRSLLYLRSGNSAQMLFAAGYHPHGIVFRKSLEGEVRRMRPMALT